MSSELELTEAGRLRLAFLIQQEKQQPIREAVRIPGADLAPWAVPVLANEERRLREASRRRCR